MARTCKTASGVVNALTRPSHSSVRAQAGIEPFSYRDSTSMTNMNINANATINANIATNMGIAAAAAAGFSDALDLDIVYSGDSDLFFNLLDNEEEENEDENETYEDLDGTPRTTTARTSTANTVPPSVPSSYALANKMVKQEDDVEENSSTPLSLANSNCDDDADSEKDRDADMDMEVTTANNKGTETPEARTSSAVSINTMSSNSSSSSSNNSSNHTNQHRIVSHGGKTIDVENHVVSGPGGSANLSNNGGHGYISKPKPDDVLAVRGKGHSKNKGNAKFRELVSSKKKAYDSNMDIDFRRGLAVDIVAQIRPGRFLKKYESTDRKYFVMDHESSVTKALFAIRDLKASKVIKRKSPSASKAASSSQSIVLGKRKRKPARSANANAVTPSTCAAPFYDAASAKRTSRPRRKTAKAANLLTNEEIDQIETLFQYSINDTKTKMDSTSIKTDINTNANSSTNANTGANISINTSSSSDTDTDTDAVTNVNTGSMTSSDINANTNTNGISLLCNIFQTTDAMSRARQIHSRIEGIVAVGVQARETFKNEFDEETDDDWFKKDRQLEIRMELLRRCQSAMETGVSHVMFFEDFAAALMLL